MPVTIVADDEPLFFALTSRPTKPDPDPAEELVAKTMSYQDRDVVITVPFPDTIELVTDVLNEHLDSPYETGSVTWVYQQIDNDLTEYVKGLKDGQSIGNPWPKLTYGAKASATFSIPYDKAQPLNRARLQLARRPGVGFGVWSLRLEFSPYKIGQAGFVQLTSQLEEAIGFLNFKAVRSTLKISRIDAAVDCIGVSPIDLIAHIPKAGKRSTYIGDEGAPETVYLYQRKPPLTKPPSVLGTKTTGTLRLALYERRDYFRQLHLPPPYGDCPVTRAEVSVRWKKGRPNATDVGTIKNLFGGRRVAYAAAVGGGTRPWKQFCMAAFGAGLNSAMSAWTPGPGPKFTKLYEKCAGDLVDQSCWDRWQDGLNYTGLEAWLKS